MDAPICPYCDVEMVLGHRREQWVCPLCFIPMPRQYERPKRVED